MFKKFTFSCFIFFVFYSYTGLYAQKNTALDTLNIQNMTLEELLQLKSSGVSSELEKVINVRLGVASKKPLSLRKSPSIISVVTAEEIQKSGARELLDVLRMIPGFDFGTDVQNSVGIGIRGNWSHEGKVLVLLDGQEMNEILYSTAILGNNYPVSQIKRIEVIRGPGSALYGGYAEYGVINIITKTGEDLNGLSVNILYGQMQKTYGRRNVSISYGKKIKDWDVSVAGLIGQGHRSDRSYTDIYGSSFEMQHTNELNPAYINAGISNKNSGFRFIYDHLGVNTQDGYGKVLSTPYPNNFTSYYLELKHTIPVSEQFVLTPRFSYKNQQPYQYKANENPADEYAFYEKSASRYRFNLSASYDVSTRLNLNFGGEVFADRATAKGPEAYWFRVYNPDRDSTTQSVKYQNYAAFMQAFWKNRLFNIVAGARYDNNSSYGDAFVPRIGLVKSVRRLNLKFLFSYSFRAPGIENVALAYEGKIKPEKTRTLELEAGYQLTRDMYLTASLFDFTTKKPIIYFTEDLTEGYTNRDKNGSQGLELEYRWKQKWGYVNLNYAYYTVANKTQVPEYRVSADPHSLLAFARHKINLNAACQITDKISVNPSASYIGKRYGYTGTDAEDNLILTEFTPVCLANLFVTFDANAHWQIAAGAYNLFNVNYQFIQPYNSGHAPLPGASREILIRLNAHF